jgi:hypothetical protein
VATAETVIDVFLSGIGQGKIDRINRKVRIKE